MIRRATPDDAPVISDLFVRARDEMTYLPRIPEHVRPLLGGWFLERAELWMAEEEGHLVGFAGLSGNELTHLYIDAPAQNRGVGTALLDHMKSLRPERLELWVFQRNDGARKFYERHGFELVRLTNGAGNMEQEPDALYEWCQPGASCANAPHALDVAGSTLRVVRRAHNREVLSCRL
jgi:GNAT superfamily N-acetyltransferase